MEQLRDKNLDESSHRCDGIYRSNSIDIAIRGKSMDRKAQHRLVVRRLFIAQLGLLGLFCLLIVVLFFKTGELGSFPFSFFAGCLGGSIALIRRLPKADDSTIEALSYGWVSTLMPLLYGGFMAAVTYVLFMSGILTGDSGGGLFTSNLFPNFNRPEAEPGALLSVKIVLQLRPNTVEDLGKLLVWCFLSGYSERFVLGILGTLEERGSTKGGGGALAGDSDKGQE